MKSKRILSLVLAFVMVLGSFTGLRTYAANEEKTYVSHENLTDTEATEPTKDDVLPDDNQYKYQKDELAAFVHFGPNTFNNIEWGEHYGDKKPNEIFKLTKDFDAETLVKSIKDAGFKKIIVTAKHHDGFCLWKSQYTDYDIESVTNYKGGKGDILEEISTAATKYNIDMGLYLSPWDIHEPSYGYYDKDHKPTTKEHDHLDYNEYYNNQLTEILSNPKYGNKGRFVEIWMDGAKGSGANAQEYSFTKWFETIQKYQGKAKGYSADAMLFGAEAYTTVRWIGNESGFANENTWSKSKVNKANNTIDSNKQGNTFAGYSDGNQWTVPEVDARITAGWFWGPNKNTPKTLVELSNMYFSSVGRNAPLLLNIPPNDQGTVDKAILDRLAEFGDNIYESFKDNILNEEGVVLKANEVRGNSIKYSPNNLLDGNDETYWTTNDGTKTGEILIDLGGKKSFDAVSIEEAIRFGQRINSYKIEYKDANTGKWVVLKEGQTIGAKRLVRSSMNQATEIKITVSTPEGKVPILDEIGIYQLSEGFRLPTAVPTGMDSLDIEDVQGANKAHGFKFTNGTWHQETGPQYENGTNRWAGQNATLELKFKGTQFYLLGTKDPNHGEMILTIDGGEEITVDTSAGARKVGQIIYESATLEDKEHTVTLKVKTKAIGIEAAMVVNNGGLGMLGLEKANYTMNENEEMEIKVKRVGGTKGEIKAKLQPNPGTAIQEDFNTELIQEITLKDGETEAKAKVQTKRNTKNTGNLQFSVELVPTTPNLIVGFINRANITINDADAQFSENNPFVFPKELNKKKVLEAENSILHNTGENEQWPLQVSTADWASEGKFVNSLNGADTITIPYKVEQKGKYEVVLTFRSGSTDNGITITDDSGHFDEFSTKAGHSDSSVTQTKTFELVAKEKGSGTLTIKGNPNGPQMDKFDITLKEITYGPEYSVNHRFVFPKVVDETKTLEAEYAELHNTNEGETWKLEVANADWASNKKFVNSLNGEDTITIPYKVEKMGRYEVTLTYRSGSNANGLNITDDSGNIEKTTVSAGHDNAQVTKTKTFELNVDKAGEGILTIKGNPDGPQMDKFDITLKEERTAPRPKLPEFSSENPLKVYSVDAGRKYFSVEALKNIIDLLSANDYTHLHLILGNDGFRFLLDNMAVKSGDKTYESQAVKDAITKGNKTYADVNKLTKDADKSLTESEMNELLEYAKTKNIKIIPALNSPGHMDAILEAMKTLGIENPKYVHNGKTSATTVDLDNQKAVDFTRDFMQLFIDYFAKKGVEIFNIGADEYANAITGAKGWEILQRTGKYSKFVEYVNSLASKIVDKGMRPMAFNDGIYYKNKTDLKFNEKIIIALWTGGWGGFDVASPKTFVDNKHDVLNVNDAWYYVTGYNTNADSQSKKRNPYNLEKALKKMADGSAPFTKNPGRDQITTIGSMVALWNDEPAYEYSPENLKKHLTTFAKNNRDYFSLPEEKFPGDNEFVTTLEQANSEKKYEIYPVVQEMLYGNKATKLSDDINLVIEDGVDAATIAKAKKIIEKLGKTCSTSNELSKDKTNILLGINGSDKVADKYFKAHVKVDNNFDKFDAYQLSVNKSNIAILGKDSDAVFYGLVTLEHIFDQLEDNQIRNIFINDYANQKIRGVIEGFYGRPWGTQARKDLLEFGGKFKNNAMIYAPKDDPYHREKWRELYPEKDLEDFRKLGEAGIANKNRFVWTIAPFKAKVNNGSEPIKDSNVDQGIKDIIAKFDQLYNVGIRQFGVLGDDVGGLPYATVVKVMKALSEWAKKKPEKVYDFVFVPQSYTLMDWGNRSTELKTYEQGFPENVHIMYTGTSVLAPVTQSSINRYKSSVHGITMRDPLFWLNWPVNDIDREEYRRVFMGKGQMLERGVQNLVGVVTNPLEEPYASLPAIFAVSDYTWNTNKFDAQKSWEDGFKYIDSNAAAELKEISTHMANTGRKGIANLDESEDLNRLMAAFRNATSKEDIKTTGEALRAGYQKIVDAVEQFRTKSKFEGLKNNLKPYISGLHDKAKAAVEYIDLILLANSGDKNSLDRANKLLESAEKNLELSKSYKVTTMTSEFPNAEFRAESGTKYINTNIENELRPKAKSALAKIENLATGKYIVGADNLIYSPKRVGGGNGYELYTQQGHTAGNMFDKNDDSFTWFGRYNPTGYQKGDYMGVDLEESRNLGKFKLVMGGRSASDHFDNYSIKISDDKQNWTTVHGPIIQNEAKKTTEFTFEKGTKARYVIVESNTNGNYWVQISEFSVEVLPNEAEKPQEKADKFVLSKLVEKSKASVVLTDKTPETIAEYQKALNKAEDVLLNKDATQAEVDEAVEKLVAAVVGLRAKKVEPKKINTEPLKVALSIAKKFDTESYTDETLKVLKDAIKLAEDRKDSADITEAEMNKLIEALSKAIKGLKVKEAESGHGETPEEPEVPETPKEKYSGYAKFTQKIRSLDGKYLNKDLPINVKVEGIVEGNRVKINYNGVEGYIYKVNLSQKPITISGYTKFTQNIRDEKGEIVGIIPIGTFVTGQPLGSKIAVSYNGKEGFIYTANLEKLPMIYSGYAKFTQNIRDINGEIIGVLAKGSGAAGKIVEGRVKLYIQGKEGYVYLVNLQKDMIRHSGIVKIAQNIRNDKEEIVGILPKGVKIEGRVEGSRLYIEYNGIKGKIWIQNLY